MSANPRGQSVVGSDDRGAGSAVAEAMHLAELTELVEGGITDDELAALALAADPEQPLDPAARPDPAFRRGGPLPPSYMPPSTTGPRAHGRVTTLVALVLVTAFTTITALGFCITYGALSFA